MNRLFSKRGVLALAVLLVILFAFFQWFWPSWLFKKHYRQIQPGDSESRVISLLGEPTRVTPEHAKVTASIHTEDDFAEFGREVAKVFSYEGRMITGEHYVISFDSNGRAVAKIELVSP